MKSRCSFILKAGTALVLCFLMLFGTVTTSLAAVIDNADTGANVDVAETGWSDVSFIGGPVDDWSNGVNITSSGSDGYGYAYLYLSSGDTFALKTYKGQAGPDSNNYGLSDGSTYNINKESTSNSFKSNVTGFYKFEYWNKDRDTTPSIKLSKVGNGSFYIVGDTSLGLTWGETSQNMTGTTNLGSNSHNGYYYTSYATNTGTYNYKFKANSYSTYQYPSSGNNSISVIKGDKITFYAGFISPYATNYSTLVEHAVSTKSNGNGSITASKAYVAKDSSVIFTLSPDPGYDVDKLVINNTNYASSVSNNSYTYTLKTDAAVTAEVTYKPKTYTISYNPGAYGTGTVNSTTKTHGSNATLSSGTFTYRGYTQDGWSVTKDSGVKDYNLGDTSYATEGNATLYPHWTAWNYPYIASLTPSSTNINVGKTATLTATLGQETLYDNGSNYKIKYNVYTNESCTTAAAASAYSLSADNIHDAKSTVFTGKTVGTYYVKAQVLDGTTVKDTSITKITVGVNKPSISHSNLTNLAVNSTTTLSPSVSADTAPTYYEFEYSLDKTTWVGANGTVTGTYFDIVGGSIIAKKPVSTSQKVYYRIKAGTDAAHISYTSDGSNSFNVTVATPSVAYTYPDPNNRWILLQDTGETATLNLDLSAYGLTNSALTWSILDEVKDANADADAESVLGINENTGALTPYALGTATIRATIKYNDSYTQTVDLTTVHVQSATLEVNKTAISTVYGTKDLALDYDNTATFTVTTNANNPAYANLTHVQVRKERDAAPFTLDPTDITSTSAQTVTATATGVGGPYKIFVEYYIGDTLVEELTKTVELTISEYETWLTIYFNDNNQFGGDSVYIWSWVPDSDGEWIKPFDPATGDVTSTAQSMKRIGTAGTNKRVFAQYYKKKDLIGAANGSARNILFCNKTSFLSQTQTADIAPLSGYSCFPNYSYFEVTGTSGNRAVTQHYDYGCLKPTKAELTVENPALPNSFESKLDFDIEVSGYTGSATQVGYYTVDTTLNYVTINNGVKHDIASNTKATAKSSGSGTDTLSGYLYFKAAGIVDTPYTTDAAKEFIGLQYETKKISVTSVKSNIHLMPVALESTNGTAGYSAISNTGIKASGTLNNTAYSNLTSNIQNDLGKTVTVSTGTVSGYTFVGYYKSTDLLDPVPVDIEPVSTSSSYTFTANEIKGEGTATDPFTSDYYVYALYRKNITVSASKSYEIKGSAATYLAAPPATITVTRDGKTAATYAYDNSASATTSSKYGNGTEISVLAGDEITLTYSALAASDSIDHVYFNNSSSATDTAAYADSKTDYTASVTRNQTNHTVKFTVTDAIKNITIDLGLKNRISFKDTEGFTTDGMNIGGYYALDEEISFIVNEKSASTCTYVIGTPKFYTTAGKQIFATQAAADAANADDGSYVIVSGFDLSYNKDSGKISGTMPDFDVVIDMGVTANYLMKFNTKVLSDVVSSQTAITTKVASAVTAVPSTGGSLITTTATASRGPSNTTGTRIVKGTEVIYSIGMASGYQFLGWYKGNATNSAPDLENGFISDSTTFTYAPSANTNVWAVATREFFINGNFTVETQEDGTTVLKHKTNISVNNNASNWTTGFTRMEYDPVEGAYAITFDKVVDSNGADLLGTRTSNANTSGTLNDSAYKTIFLFKTYESQSASATNYWNKVSTYDKSYIQWSDSYHMYYGKWYGDGGSGMFEYTKKTNDNGYATPITLYFKPGSSTSTWSIKATKVWPDVYISNGYSNIDDYTNSTDVSVKIYKNSAYATDTSLVTSSTTYAAVPGAEQLVKKYQIKQQGAKIQLSKTVDATHEVAGFVVYDLTDDRVYPLTATRVGTTNEYTAELTLGENNLYIVPIIWYNGSDAMTVHFNATQLDKNEWGDLVSCYPWYATGSGKQPYGSYPGQLMLPSDDATMWTAKFKPKYGNYDLQGITFANYIDGGGNKKYTWLGRDNVMGSGNIIPQYNKVERSSSATYNLSNCQVQTYDYREPIAMYNNNKGSEDAAVLTFAIKTGNTNYMTVYGEASDGFVGMKKVNVLTYKAPSAKYQPTFEYLTNAAGDSYTDISGNPLSDQPTPSFYVVAKGMESYENSKHTREFGSGNAYKTTSDTYGVSLSGNMYYAVQWYVYDASGNYILDVLSAAYADEVKSMTNTTDATSTQHVIAKLLEDKGYAVDGKAVGISYDYPRYCYGDNGTGSNFNAYRFTGQWYATTNSQPVTANVKVGIFTDGGYELSESNNESYGSATANIDYERVTSGYMNITETDKTNSKAVFALGDAPKKPVYFNAEPTNFVGWYYVEPSSGKLVQAADKTQYELFNPSITSNITYYAMYEVKAAYTFLYLDRNGETAQYVVNHTLKSDEIKGYSGNGNKPNVPTYIWTTEAAALYESNPYTAALKQVQDYVSSYQYSDFAWPTVNSDGSVNGNGSVTPVSKMKNLQIIADCPRPEYTVTYYKVSGNTKSGPFTKKVTAFSALSSMASYKDHENVTYWSELAANGFTANGFSYWSSDEAGNNLVTTMFTYGLLIMHDTTLYAQYNKSVPAGNPWKPTIESLTTSRKMTTSSDTAYLDFNTNFVTTQNEYIYNMETKPHYGILVAYDTSSGTYAELSDATAKKYIKYMADNNLKTGKITGTNIVLTLYDYNDDEHISNRNRTNFYISDSHSGMIAKKLTVYTYVYTNTPKVYLSSTNFATIGGTSAVNKLDVSKLTFDKNTHTTLFN